MNAENTQNLKKRGAHSTRGGAVARKTNARGYGHLPNRRGTYGGYTGLARETARERGKHDRSAGKRTE